MIDDIFNISRELMILIGSGVTQTGEGRLRLWIFPCCLAICSPTGSYAVRVQALTSELRGVQSQHRRRRAISWKTCEREGGRVGRHFK